MSTRKSRVKELRKQLGYTQMQMAEHLKISFQSYNAKENGRMGFNENEMKTMKYLVNRDVDSDATIDSIFFTDE